jgi:hypothetical protein
MKSLVADDAFSEDSALKSAPVVLAGKKRRNSHL